MDTASHLLFGSTLAGLAMLDPVIAQQPALAGAVLTVTLAGSHAPDLDTVARLKGYSAYIRTHRGVTHSLPALLLWPIIIAIPAAAAFHVWTYSTSLLFWAFIAVALHIMLDWFNAYGVQCFRPLSNKWNHLDILPLFDPFLFTLHSAGLLVWIVTEWLPGTLFAAVYGITVAYIGIRAFHHQRMVNMVRRQLKVEGICHVLPGLSLFRWQFVLESGSHFYTGTIRGRKMVVKDVYKKDSDHTLVQATLTTDGVRAFLHFAQRVHVSCKEMQDGYLVEWRDVRFWHNHELPFGVDVRLDRNLQVVDQYLGWRKKAWEPPFV